MKLRRLLPLVLAVGLIVAACSGSDASDEGTPTTEPGPTGSLVAQDGDLVEVHYVGTLDDGSEFQSSRDRGTPFSFTVGIGEVLSGFDDAVRGASVGDVNTVRMEPEDAYGEWSEDNVIEVPFNPEQGDIEVGDEVYLTNGQPAVILEITDETVTLDANHFLAGEALMFEIEVLAITRP